MKKSAEITVHCLLWVMFTLFVITLCKMSQQLQPEALFVQHFSYVVFLELVMGLIIFYVSFFGADLVRRKKINPVVYVIAIITLILVFAYPATRFGFWQVMSSLVPHIGLVLLAVVLRRFINSFSLVER